MSGYVHRFVVAAEHPCLPGHFPGHALVPGVYVLEEVARALRRWRDRAPLCLLEAKFVAPLRPGQTAQVRLLPAKSAVQVLFDVRAGEQLLARGRLEHAP